MVLTEGIVNDVEAELHIHTCPLILIEDGMLDSLIDNCPFISRSVGAAGHNQRLTIIPEKKGSHSKDP
jgi:hypothetical protein